MAKEICISSTPHETRLAILEDDQLAEIYYERENEYTLAGSIYNGRVTRVLPGMQSAFVDVGLERDAFLYVTDFLELEDAEETDEIEKAAASGGNQAPREVRHSSAAESNGSRGDVRPPRTGPRNGQKPDQKQDPNQKQAPEQQQESRPERPAPDRQPKERRFAVEAIPDAADSVPQSSFISEETDDEQADNAHGDSGEPGAKRWRGRRRRRGGRGGTADSSAGQTAAIGSKSNSAKPSTESAPYALDEAQIAAEIAPVIQAVASQSGAQAPDDGSFPQGGRYTGGTSERNSSPGRSTAPAPHGSRSETFVLPGESLSKYGRVAEDEAAQSAAVTVPQAHPASTFKPATLIEAPLDWDGSGLLPGESLSRHRSRQPEPAEALPAETIQPASASDSSAEQAAETTPERFVPDSAEEQRREEEIVEPLASVEENGQEEHKQEDRFQESAQSAPEPPPAAEEPDHAKPQDTDDYTVESVIEEPSADETVADAVIRQDEIAVGMGSDKPAIAETLSAEPIVDEPEEPESDRAASHHIDSAPPSTFRLFGLGGKKKAEEPVADAVEAPDRPDKPAVKLAFTAAVSTYAPGSGHLEEELIDEEEFDAPHHHGKVDEQDIEDFEEETLPPQMRSGDLGELLQEAHLDHKIQLNFDGKNGEDDEAFDDEDEDEPASGNQQAAGEGQARQPRDRASHGRRGRGPQGAQGNRRGPSRRSMQTSNLPIISDLLKPGQEILVQIAKEPIAKKGARITSHIALPGRFLVFMPTVSHIGVSRKIESDEERQRLKRILVHERGEASGGFIVRTAAEGASEEDLRADLRFLIHLWNEIKTRSDDSKSPALIYHDLSLIERILRDQVSSNFSSIWVDSEADYERIVRFLNRFSPTLVRRVKLYTKETPLFEHFGIQDEISKALRSKVWLKSGGSIVINQTEALVAIDINTGKYVGKSARLEDTIVKTNLDAVPEIVRQIRLRDLGGIIVIDFIDMDERKNRFKVLAALEEALKADRAPTKVLQFNDFGLVAITRKRVKQSLERTLSVPCPTCQATGMVKSPTTVCNEIYTELRKMKKHFEGEDVLLRVNPETVKVLKSNNASWLSEFEELVGKNILVKSDATLHPEQFDIQG
jgi:ribonuclease G